MYKSLTKNFLFVQRAISPAPIAVIGASQALNGDLTTKKVSEFCLANLKSVT